MKASLGLLNAGAFALALAACQTTAPTAEDVADPGNSAGSAGRPHTARLCRRTPTT